MAVDWLKIKSEYVNGSISLRKLADMFSVSYSQVAKVAASEKWSEARKNQRIKIESATNQKTEEKISDALSSEAAAKVEIRAGLVKLAADWVKKQKAINDTNDFRRMVQSCVELGILTVQEENETEDDGLLAALGANAQAVFGDGDDSGMLPKEKEQ